VRRLVPWGECCHEPCKKVGVWPVSAGHRRYIGRNLIATALTRVISAVLRPSFSRLAQPALTSLGVVAARRSKSPDLALGAAEPPPARAGRFLCASTMWRLSVATTRPYPCCGPAAESTFLNPALNLSPEAAVHKLVWELVSAQPPKPPTPQPTRRPRQSLPTPERSAGLGAGSLARQPPRRDVSGATRQAREFK